MCFEYKEIARNNVSWIAAACLEVSVGQRLQGAESCDDERESRERKTSIANRAELS